MRSLPILVCLTACSVSAACGGGDGGTSPVRMPVPFTAFSAVQPDQTVSTEGLSQSFNATTDGSGVVLSRIVSLADTTNSRALLTFGPTLTLTAVSATTPGSSPSWSGVDVACDPNVCAVANSTSAGAVNNALGTLNWNYQTFGYWLTTGPGNNILAAALSIGNQTPANGVPISGTATYVGITSGVYVNTAGTVFVHAADMSSAVNFATRTVNFSTSNTNIAPLATPVALTPDSSLNLAGTLTYSAGASQFSGPVSAPGFATPLTGTATGRFYGPAAQEMGGIFGLTGTGQQTMLGGFGGKR